MKMSRQPQKIIGALTANIHKSSRIAGAIENASEKAQSFQNVASEKYNTLVKNVHGGTATIIQDFREARLQPSRPVPRQLIDWFKWYEHLTGIEDVELSKRQVIDVQDKLFECQDKRRNLTNESSQIAEKLKDIYGELLQTRRDDPKYVQLTITENKSLQEQGKIMTNIKLLENEERDYFTQLATAIKEYHDSQQINAQKYKYLSILASAAIAIISLGGSMIYNNRRITDVRNVITSGQIKNEELFKNYFDTLDLSLKEILENNKHIIESSSLKLNESNESQDSEKSISQNNIKTNDTHLNLYEQKNFIIGGTVLAICYLISRFVT
ncbi:hypothetical protein HCN44_003675 [Aphidius gifuensis]|uniref:Uncharacterized protein n=1 Tax=Aphidius gifuensis TaxID=684658 RepID=A0A835CL19_APHGI|nr:uncharacterized protein LOC122858798 [Aphidius gifuensis]KAF7987812.1 hypothetical protein HCN44_003675 [Aphidius gifuensis]